MNRKQLAKLMMPEFTNPKTKKINIIVFNPENRSEKITITIKKPEISDNRYWEHAIAKALWEKTRWIIEDDFPPDTGS